MKFEINGDKYWLKLDEMAELIVLTKYNPGNGRWEWKSKTVEVDSTTMQGMTLESALSLAVQYANEYLERIYGGDVVGLPDDATVMDRFHYLLEKHVALSGHTLSVVNLPDWAK